MNESSAEANIAKDHDFEISVNKTHFKWESGLITGRQVRDLVHEDERYKVYIKVKHGDDIPVPDDTAVDLKDEENRHFLTIARITTEGAS